MSRTYDVTKLALNDPESLAWALAYVRFALRDKPNDQAAYPSLSLEDAEIDVFLEADVVTHDETDYYLPHRVAARLLLGNPEWVQRYSAGGFSDEFRDAREIARGIIRQGAFIDALVDTATDGAYQAGQLRLTS